MKLTSPQRRIVNGIRRLHARGAALNISAIRISNPSLLLDTYRIKPFWGWKQALEAAGIDYSRIRIHLEEYVICQECGKRFKDLTQHITRIHGISAANYRSKHPGSELASPARVASARQEEKTSLPHWEPDWTPEYVLDRIYEFHRRGLPLNPGHMQTAERSTHRRAITYFKTWNTALRAVGLDPKDIWQLQPAGQWTRNRVIKEICRLHALGYRVNPLAILRRNYSLYAAARRLFKDYDEMLRTCRLNPDEVRLLSAHLSKEEDKRQTIDRICRRKFDGKLLHDRALRIGADRDLRLWNKGRRLFGTWSRAVKAAGFDYSKITPRRLKYKTADDVLREIKRRHAKGMVLGSTDIRKNGPEKDIELYGRADRLFKDWRTAVEAAGIDYTSVQTPRKLRYPTRKAVLQEIKRRHQKGLTLATRKIKGGPKRDVLLYHRALAFFRNWAAAVELAGVKAEGVYPPHENYLTEQEILDAIRKRHSAGKSMNRTATERGEHANRPLLNKAIKRFGSWQAAVEKAGLDYFDLVLRHRKRYPTSEAVLNEIRRRFKVGLPVTVGGVRRGETPDHALHQTARKTWGSWEKAVTAAGVDYDTPKPA